MANPHDRAHPTRIAVVGAGNVGSTFAFALVLSGLAAEIVLIDANRERADGEAMDLAHAVPFSRPARVWAGDYPDAAGAAITIIAAGTAQRPGETRLDLLRRNDAIFGEIVPAVAAANPDGIIVVATNPVDVLAYRSWKLSGLPSSRVIGSGTILDTARFRAALGEHLGVDARSVHAFIIGEHGDSEVAVWSSANVGGIPVAEYAAAAGLRLAEGDRERIFVGTRDAAYRIIERKGATYYAVAAGLIRLTEAILRDQHTVLSVSSLVDGYAGISDVYLSLPAVIGRDGVEHVLTPTLTDEEAERLRASGRILRDSLDQLEAST
jgi:L-lactate dehydrogenase